MNHDEMRRAMIKRGLIAHDVAAQMREIEKYSFQMAVPNTGRAKPEPLKKRGIQGTAKVISCILWKFKV